MDDPEATTPAEKAVLAVVLYMEKVEAFRDLVMTETTAEEKFGLMGEVIGSIMEYLMEHPEHLRALLADRQSARPNG